MYFERPFYEASAAVLPILLLVLTVGEIRENVVLGLSDLFFALIVAASMILGEFFCLAVLSSGHDSPFESTIVVLGLALGLFHIMWEFSILLLKEAEADPRVSRRRFLTATNITFGFVAIVVFGGAGFLMLSASR